MIYGIYPGFVLRIRIVGGKDMERKQIKALIELSNSFEEANEVIEKYTGYTSFETKIAYLKGMFDCSIVGEERDSLEVDYIALLTAIVNYKWRI